MTQKYCLYDLEGCGWWEYTHTEPMTEKEIIELFREYAYQDDLEGGDFGQDEGFFEGKHFDLDFIADLWQVDIVPCEQKEQYENEHYEGGRYY